MYLLKTTLIILKTLICFLIVFKVYAQETPKIINLKDPLFNRSTLSIKCNIFDDFVQRVPYTIYFNKNYLWGYKKVYRGGNISNLNMINGSYDKEKSNFILSGFSFKTITNEIKKIDFNIKSNNQPIEEIFFFPGIESNNCKIFGPLINLFDDLNNTLDIRLNEFDYNKVLTNINNFKKDQILLSDLLSRYNLENKFKFNFVNIVQKLKGDEITEKQKIAELENEKRIKAKQEKERQRELEREKRRHAEQEKINKEILEAERKKKIEEEKRRKKKLAEEKARKKKLAEQERKRKLAQEKLNKKIKYYKRKAENFYKDIENFVKSGGNVDLVKLSDFFDIKPNPKSKWNKSDLSRYEELRNFMVSIPQFVSFEKDRIGKRLKNSFAIKDQSIEELEKNLSELKGLMRKMFGSSEIPKIKQMVKDIQSTLSNFKQSTANKVLKQSSTYIASKFPKPKIQKKTIGITTDDWKKYKSQTTPQQQQFCTLTKRFFKDLQKAKISRNEIMVNMVHKERQENLDALIPQGKLITGYLRLLK